MLPACLPLILDLRRVTQALAMLDAILCPEWEYRYHSFDSRWNPATGATMASMRNGSGDHWFLLFDANGAALKGFAHETARDRGLACRVRQAVPARFAAFLDEAAFSMEDVGFCFWQEADDPHWHKVPSTLADTGQGIGSDGSDDLLALLATSGGPTAYRAWAEEYFEAPVSLAAVEAVFAHQPLHPSLVRVLAPDADLDLDALRADADEIGYPFAP